MTEISNPAALFQSVSDSSRLRLLRLLGREELNVQELVRITGLSQPRVSKHLAVLRDQRWLEQRREGTWNWYRCVAPERFAAGPEFFREVLLAADTVAEAEQDDQRLAGALRERLAATRDFFSGIADRWDELRSGFEHPDLQLGAISALVEPGLRILDIGTGTGAMLPVLAGARARVVALDNSQAMLDRARARARAEGLTGIGFCAGDIATLPFADGVFDAVNCGMTLHHVAGPEAALREMARVVRPGGPVLVTAFCSHELHWMRDELAHRWLGFERDQMEGFFRSAGLAMDRYLVRGRAQPETGNGRAPGARAVEWPDVFLAAGSGGMNEPTSK